MKAWLIVVLCGAVTALSRFLPFLLFPESREIPKKVQLLKDALPSALIGLLVIYCLKDLDFLSGSHGIPELLSIAVVAFLHFWKRNTLVSIACGTACYMFLIQVVFR